MEIVVNVLTVALGCGIFYYGNQHAGAALKKIRRAYRNRGEARRSKRQLANIEARKATRLANAKAAAAEELCLLYTSPSPRDVEESRMPSSA